MFSRVKVSAVLPDPQTAQDRRLSWRAFPGYRRLCAGLPETHPRT